MSDDLAKYWREIRPPAPFTGVWVMDAIFDAYNDGVMKQDPLMRVWMSRVTYGYLRKDAALWVNFETEPARLRQGTLGTMADGVELRVMGGIPDRTLVLIYATDGREDLKLGWVPNLTTAILI